MSRFSMPKLTDEQRAELPSSDVKMRTLTRVREDGHRFHAEVPISVPRTVEWRDVVGYEGLYEVSSVGDVRRRGGCVLKLQFVKGYRQVTLRKDGKNRRHSVHRLLLEAFVGPCPEGMETRHLNGVRWDNQVSNLAWGTKAEQTEDKKSHGTYTGRRWPA